MYHIRTSLLVAFVLALGSFTSPLFAQEEPEILTGTAGEVTSIRIADVSIRDARLVSQTGIEAQISFTITNGEGTQPGVKIAVELREGSETEGKTLDRRVYDEQITLTPGSSLEKTVTYYAPPFLKGDYELWVFLGNEGGIPLGVTRAAGTMKLFGSGQYITLSACVFSASSPSESVGPKTSASRNVPPPTPSGGTVASPQDSTTVTCKATNNFTETKTADPSFVTFRGSPYGALVPTVPVENAPVTLKVGQSKPISFVIPKPKDPGTYSATLTLTADNRSLSNLVSFSYAVSGLSANIESLSSDKSAYKQGENAKLTLVWSSSKTAPVAPDAQNTTSKFFLDLSLVDGNGRECGKPLSGVALERGISSFELPVTENCVAPMVLARISDANGRLLAQKNAFLSDVKGVPAKGETPARTILVLGIVGLLVLLALIVVVYEKMKKNATASLMRSLLFLMVAVSVFGSWGAERAYAATLTVSGCTFCTGAQFAVDVNYNQNNNTVSVYGTGGFWPWCGVRYCRTTLSATGVGSSAGLVDELIHWNGNSSNSPGSAIFSAPTQPGTYSIRFYGWMEQEGTHFYTTGSAFLDIPFIVLPPTQIQVSPDIDFGEVPVGETRGGMGFTVSNSGSGTLSGSVASFDFVRPLAKLPFVREALAALAPPFAWTSDQSFSLSPGASTNKGVSFSPSAPVYSRQPAYFNSNAGQVFRSVSGTGAGEPDHCSSVSRPSAWLSVDPDYVDYGGEATLSWGASNADSCTLDGSGVGTSGERSTGSLTSSQSYSLSCSNSCYSGGNAANSSAYITVGGEPAPADGAYVSLWADDYSVTSGSGTTLRWNSRDVSSCSASGGWDGGKNTSGDELTGGLYDDTTFRITCDDNQTGGTLSDSVFIQIASAGDVSGLNINFYADPDIVTQGQSSTLYWSTQNADSCSASGGWSGGKGTDGSEGTDSLYSDTSYSLTCENSSDSLTRSTTVTVDASRNPNLDFWSDSDSVPYDSGTTLRWDAQNVNSCSASGGWSGGKGTSGDEWTGDLTSPTTYNLDCSGSYGSVSRQVRVQVQPTFFLDNSNDIKVTVVKGKPAKSSATTLTIDRRLSFSQPVTFSVSDINPSLPGAKFHFTPETLDSSEYSTGALFTVTAPGNTGQRDYTITVEANGGGITRSVDVIMGVTVIDPNFKEF